MPEFDLIVVGGGPAGEHAVGRATAQGLEVALVEEGLIGGECSYWACIPSKTLIRPTQMLAEVRAVPGAREAVSGDVDVTAALARRDYMTSSWDDSGQVQWVAGTGAALVRGRGRIAGERTVEVDTPGGRREKLTARRAVLIAVGSGAAIPPIDGLAETRFWTNREVTASESVPNRLAVLGGGVVGVEMAQAWRRLGSAEVTIIEAGERLLANAEPFASEAVATAFAAEGIRVLTGQAATKVARPDRQGPVTVTLADGTAVTADELLVAVGRRARTGDLGLATVGLEDRGYIGVDDQLRVQGVAGEWLYAIGDVNGRALLTHMGKYQARIAVDVICGRDAHAWADERAIPSVVFSDPMVASVGLTEYQAREQGRTVRVARTSLDAVAAAAIWGEGLSGTCQLVVDEAEGVPIGATFVGSGLGEMLHAATIAIVGEIPMARLRHAVAAFPTLSEVWLEMVEGYLAA